MSAPEAKRRMDEKRDMTVDQAAEYFQVHRSTIWRLIKKGDLVGYSVGQQFRIRRESVEALRRGESPSEGRAAS